MWCLSSCLGFLQELLWSWRMGAGSSSSASDEDRELQDVENRLGIDLPLLKTAFCRLAHVNAAESDPQQLSVHLSELEDCFNMKSSPLPDESTSDLGKLVPHLGAAVATMFFRTRTQDVQVRWIDFLNGYDACFQPRTRLKMLLAFFRELESRAEITSEKLRAEEKLEGRLSQRQFGDFLRLCWLLMYSGRRRCQSQLIDVRFLVNGAFGTAKTEEISLDAVYSWMTSNIPKVATALALYVRVRLESSEEGNSESEPAVSPGLLTPERAWALGLSQNDQTGNSLLYQSQMSLLYRSSVHGKGMNRFWAQVEGYKSMAMLLMSVASAEGGSPWVIGAVMPAGVENKSSFYGSASSCLVAVEPKFAVFRARGVEKNYVYTYKAVAGGGYVAKPMPNGIGFGGSLGQERLWLNDDFSTLTLRHYASDKTYQAGFPTPKEGYAPIELPVLEVELWGLGGKDAEEQMLAFQKRENLFSEQRRKVDLKAFGNWQDSPEKMMMDMVSDPNRPQREER